MITIDNALNFTITANMQSMTYPVSSNYKFGAIPSWPPDQRWGCLTWSTSRKAKLDTRTSKHSSMLSRDRSQAGRQESFDV